MIRDPLDDLGTSEFEAQHPGLGQLFSDLTSPPVDSEHAGEQAALSMFRAVRAEQTAAVQTATAQAATAQAATQVNAGAATAAQTQVLGSATGKPTRRPAGSRRRSAGSAPRRPASAASARKKGPSAPAKKARVGGRLVAAAMFLAIAGGFAAAGYAAVLPAPLQRVAFQILGFAGVPDAPNRQPRLTNTPPAGPHTVNHSGPATSPSPSAPGSASPHHPKSPKPKKKSHSHSPSPHPSSPGHRSGPVKIAIAAQQQEITAGQSVQITASLTRHGQPGAGIQLSLLEKATGRTGQAGGSGGPAKGGWQVVGQVATDVHGQANFHVSDVTTNALFRVTDPSGATSGRVQVVVVLPITASLQSGARPKQDLLVASSPLAQPGEAVELEANVGGSWQVVHLHRLHKDGQTVFTIPLRKIPVTYRVLLPESQAHAESASNQVTAPARIHHAKKLPH
ncbi:MAG TPA: hypothetical protein VN767_19140 [Streptosporangiaceae bacterium]|nr:hypothetical protein [Streptosporangiaceae bacterium]